MDDDGAIIKPIKAAAAKVSCPSTKAKKSEANQDVSQARATEPKAARQAKATEPQDATAKQSNQPQVAKAKPKSKAKAKGAAKPEAVA